ncbi:MAG: bifunctional demethylmenaquinone methyltransferase/2-methoxy-6-polyprenyl-1,4-benzoquinol methylase UbiE [Deltaproteobacteria bacterium]|nr:bifunctional demethylmenaquinone methyltransferase/2-methoxy-6-polyprenyl-1,4-benzoquinol methylase UbiE [Deltaproteobacteria bacterium]
MKDMELPFIREMFDSIAPRYDLLNRLLSLNQDIYWRRTMVSAIEAPGNGVLLDVACGTGDVAIEILRQNGGTGASIFGVDFSHNMLKSAKNKIKSIPDSSNIYFLAGNAFNLPFREETFDAITIAFGIRNICDKLSVLKLFYDSLKSGGMLLVLELATPSKGFLLSLYLFYFKIILPLIGWFLSKNLKAYQYLPASVAKFPDPKSFAAIMRSAGFINVRWKSLTMGIANLHVGYKNE